MNRNCLICQSKFPIYKSTILSAKFCSIICKNKSQIGKKRPEVTGKNNYWFGKKLSLKRRKEISKRMKNKVGEKACHWKGEDVGYEGIHRWIEKRLGKPKQCSIC